MSAVLTIREDMILPRMLPPELLTTDRILQRWAVSVGLGLPTEEWDDNPRARPPILDDATAVVVDRIYCTSPPRTKEFVRLWYRTPHPVSVIARRLVMRAESVYKSHIVILGYLRWRFEASGHADLIALIGARDT